MDSQITLGFTVAVWLALSLWALWHLYCWTILPNPTSKGMANELIRITQSLPIAIDASICDCGSGLGILVARLRAAGYTRAYGIEGSTLIWAISCLLAPWTRLPTRCLKWGRWQDLYKSADVLTFYISPKAMEYASWELQRVKKPLWVITHTFKLPGFEPNQVHWYRGLYVLPIYIYYIKPT